MNQTVIFYYQACFAISLFTLAYVFSSKTRRSVYQIFAVCMIAISCGGYLSLALANSLEEAILANKILYIGGSFLPLVYFLISCEICKIRVHKLLMVGMILVQVILFLFICTIGKNGLYYNEVNYAIEDGIVVLQKTYGPAHMLYLVTLYGYMFLAFFSALYALRVKRTAINSDVIIVLIGFTVAGFLFAMERVLHLKVELMPAVYALNYWFMQIPVSRKNIFQVESEVAALSSENMLEGYISLNKQLCIMDYNDRASVIFPEITQYNFGEVVPLDATLFSSLLYSKIKNAAKLLEQGEQTETISIRENDRFYECVLRKLTGFGSKTRGFLLKLVDVTDKQKYTDMIEEMNQNLGKEVLGKTQRIREIQEKTLLGMAQMVESRDLSTGGHIKRTSQVVSVFARELLRREMGFTKEFLEYVERSAPMHDLGKITVDDIILRKQGKFTDEEYAVMKKHSAAGAEIVKRILTGIEDEEFVQIATNVAHYHHEKVNGKGYPDGLSGEQIPLEARIMALADVFDALVSKRCYKDAFTFDRAFQIIKEDSGTHFDEKLASVFIACRPELELLYNNYEED